MKLARITVIAAAGVAIAAFAGVFQPSGARSAPAADASTDGITVLGTGSVSVVPDRASFAFGTVSVKPNMLPLPTALVTFISPPISATSCWHIARPRPAPP